MQGEGMSRSIIPNKCEAPKGEDGSSASFQSRGNPFDVDKMAVGILVLML